MSRFKWVEDIDHTCKLFYFLILHIFKINILNIFILHIFKRCLLFITFYKGTRYKLASACQGCYSFFDQFFPIYLRAAKDVVCRCQQKGPLILHIYYCHLLFCKKIQRTTFAFPCRTQEQYNLNLSIAVNPGNRQVAIAKVPFFGGIWIQQNKKLPLLICTCIV